MREGSGALMETFCGSIDVAGSTDGAATAARFHSPAGLAADEAALFVADFANNALRRIAIADGSVSTLVGPEHLHHPFGVAVTDTMVFVSDMDNDRVVDVDVATGRVAAIGTTLQMPSGIASQASSLFVLSSCTFTISELDRIRSTISLVAGTPDNAGYRDGRRQAARLGGVSGPGRPEGVASGLTAHRDVLFVADPCNDAVRRIDLLTGELQTIVGPPIDRGADRFGTGDAISDPRHLAGHRDYLFVTDRDGIVRIDLASNHVRRIATCTNAHGIAVVSPWLYVARQHAVCRLALSRVTPPPA